MDRGEPVRIIGGARLVGRTGEWDVGVLDMQTKSSAFLPSENFGVARVRRHVINDRSNAGGMITTRLGADGSYNVGYGLDTRINVFGDDYLSLQWAQTIDDSVTNHRGFQFGPASLLRLTYGRNRSRGFTYYLSGRYQGRDYRPELGFISRQNVSEIFYYAAYFHYPTGGSSGGSIPSNSLANSCCETETARSSRHM